MTGNHYSIRYGFTQHFNFPAETAYKWCIDYDPKDLQRMGEKGTRRITRLTEDTIILDDISQSNGKRIKKVKLVRLNPERHSWTSTHLAGPIKHSQFLYEIISEGTNTSHLNFTGLQINYSEKKPSPATVARLAAQLRKEDSHGWKLLALAMENDLDNT